MLHHHRTALAAAVGLLAASGVSAQTDVSLNRAGSGARAAGMGDAFIAVSDDGTAASWNPAGLGQLRQPEFSLVYGASGRRLQMSGLRSLDGAFAYSTHAAGDNTAAIDFASAALPFSVAGKPVTLQAGWHRLYQLTGELGGATQRVSLDDPTVAPVSIDRTDRLEGGISVLSAAGAVRVTTHVAVGASVNFWRGDWNERASVVEQPGPGGATAFFNLNATDRVRGHNVALGLLFTYPGWNVGIVHHAPFWSSYSSRSQRVSSLSPAESFDFTGLRFRLPRSLGLGLARRLPSRWTIAASLTRDDWTDALIDRIPGVPGSINFFDGRPPELTTTRDTVSVNLGVEHLFVRDGSVIPVRVGFGREPQGAMDPYTRDPVDYTLAAGGAGYNNNSIKLDVAVQLRWASIQAGPTLSVAEFVRRSVRPDAVGRADAREWRLKLSLIYRLQDTEKLRDLLRRVLG
jgi:hypothetical protein